MSDGAAALGRLRALVDVGLTTLDFGEPFDVAPLAEAMRYSLLAGGKRVRPVLCLATAEGFGCAAEYALPTALALELVHTFSLVHDDLPALDDDALRRGRPTAHVVYGEDIAVLAGDALLNHAFALVCDFQDASDAIRAAALSELVSAVGLSGMIGGQYRDVRPDDALDGSGLERTSRLKTGALLGSSAACGAIVAGADEGAVETARAFGVELGLLFQIVDDILDETGSDEALGKQAGADARRGRRTFASELGLAGAQERAAESERAARTLLGELPVAAHAPLGALVSLVATRDR
ncbi:MAG: geranylgeranyl diphosphate synthase, type [Gaiellales bacterium]|jgi:geranylgeranyl diphosphate synthase type II|nr:geranylgeranyl diphosphate synthase, type [Gaiellales bacterium]